MRDGCHGDLGQLGTDLATMCGLAADATAACALMTADLSLAELVIGDDQVLDAWRARCAKRAYQLLSP